MLKGSERNGSVLVAHHSHSLVSIPSTLPSTAATATATPPLPPNAASTASRALTAAAIPIARVISTATAVAAGASTTS